MTILNIEVLKAQAGGGAGNIMTIVMFGLMFVVMYFFMIRPQQKKQKDAKTFRENLKKGDTVVTIGGLLGKIVEMNDMTVVLDVDKATRLTFERESISMEMSKKAQDNPDKFKF